MTTAKAHALARSVQKTDESLADLAAELVDVSSQLLAEIRDLLAPR
jgi:hypothetical protein